MKQHVQMPTFAGRKEIKECLDTTCSWTILTSLSLHDDSNYHQVMMNVYYCVHCDCSLDLHVSACPAITQNPAACPYLFLLKIPAVSPCLLLLVHVHSPSLSHPSQPLQYEKTTEHTAGILVSK